MVEYNNRESRFLISRYEKVVIMMTVRAETIVEKDGEVHLSDLPCQKGDRVEVILTIHEKNDEEVRAEARRSFIEQTKQSKFRSEGPYPTRDELHERH